MLLCHLTATPTTLHDVICKCSIYTIQNEKMSIFRKWSRLKRPFCPVFKWSGPFKNRLHRDHSKTDLQNVQFSTDSGFRMVGFQIPTVLVYLLFSDSQFGADSLRWSNPSFSREGKATNHTHMLTTLVKR